MGNAITATAGGGAGGKRKAKIMKINGEFFKLGTPSKVADVLQNYPGHILLDSDEFRRFNLRARPLDPETELQPKKIYLLVELPRFPDAEEAELAPRRTNSGEIVDERSQTAENFMISENSASDLFVTARSEAESGGEDASSAAVRVKVKVPKAQVERILEQSRDGNEAAQKIIDLCMDDGVRAAEEEAGAGEEEEEGARNGRWSESELDETTEKVSFSKYSVKLHFWRSPYSNHHSKYNKLTNN